MPIRLYFRNMKQIYRTFKVNDKNIRQLNYIYIDLDVKINKVETLSTDDIELLKALQAEKQDSMSSPEKAKNNRSQNVQKNAGLSPEVIAVKQFRTIV
jgi:hypothetical protein